MARVHTHYDNLKVARDAPMEVIHAAYRSLAAMYHPDRNGGSEEAARIMRIINTSYTALCDPIRKREHDHWIDNVASDPIPETPPPPAESKHGQTSGPIRLMHIPPATNSYFSKRWMWIVSGGVFASVILFWVLGGGIPDNRSAMPNKITPGDIIEQPGAQQTAPTAEPESAAPQPLPEPSQSEAIVKLAPNGKLWPKTSGYLPGFPIGNATGGSTATIRNNRTDDDMLVNLFDHASDRVVRKFFLRAREDFVLENLDPGEYDIRYENLRSGEDRESEPFSLSQHGERHAEPDGTHIDQVSSTFELTLYPVLLGNTRSRVINRERFLGNR